MADVFGGIWQAADDFYSSGEISDEELRKQEKISKIEKNLAGAESKAQSITGDLSAGLKAKPF